MKKETYEFTDEQITKMNYYDRRAALIAELNKNLVKNRETDDYDYIDLKGINDVLHPLKCKYKITDMPCKEDNGDMSLIMIDSLTGEKHGKITIPWPGNDDEHNNNMRKIQITGANITYLRRYLLMLAYDISGAGDARIHQRHLHVFHQVQPGQQIVLLEDKAQHFVADSGQLVAVHLAHIPAVEPVGAVGGHIQTTDDVHTSGFARTGLTHDGHELAFFDFHGDVVGSLYRGIAHLVIFADFIKLDQSAHSSLLRQSTTTAPVSAGSMPSAGSSASAAGASPFSVSSGSVSSPPSARSALFPAPPITSPPISS